MSQHTTLLRNTVQQFIKYSATHVSISEQRLHYTCVRISPCDILYSSVSSGDCSYPAVAGKNKGDMGITMTHVFNIAESTFKIVESTERKITG